MPPPVLFFLPESEILIENTMPRREQLPKFLCLRVRRGFRQCAMVVQLDAEK